MPDPRAMRVTRIRAQDLVVGDVFMYKSAKKTIWAEAQKVTVNVTSDNVTVRVRGGGLNFSAFDLVDIQVPATSDR